MIEIQKVSSETLSGSPGFVGLLQDYAKESSIDGMPEYRPHYDMYRAMESSGFFHMFGAFDGEELIGFLTMLTTTLPHYSVNAGTVESFYVAESKRNTGAGMALLKAAEEFAKVAGCVALLVSAPCNSRLSQIMPRVGYRRANEIFFRSIA